MVAVPTDSIIQTGLEGYLQTKGREDIGDNKDGWGRNL